MTTESKRSYGVNPPALSLENAKNIIIKIHSHMGDDFTKSELAHLLGSTTKSSTFTHKVRALRNLGLIVAEDHQLRMTPLAKKVVSPSSEGERPRALKEAMLKIDTLNRIYLKFEGGLLRQREYLTNWIVQDTEIPVKLKNAWADYFREAAKSAGLLVQRDDGADHLLSEPLEKDTPKGEELESPAARALAGVELFPQQPSGGMELSGIDQLFRGIGSGSYREYLLSGGKKARFYMPDGLTTADAKKLRPALKSLESEIDALMTHDDETPSGLLNTRGKDEE